MKIVLFNTVCGTGSTGKIVKDLYNAYKNDGNEVKVIFGRGKNVGVPDEDAICFNSKFDFYYHVLMSRIFDTQGLHSKRATQKIISFLNNFKPDVIHLHNIHGYYLNYKMLFEYLAKSKIKLVWSLHDCMMITGHCSHFDYIKCDKWKTECCNCPNKHEYPTSWVFDNSRKQFNLKKELFNKVEDTTIVCPSYWLLNKVKESILSKNKLALINTGIDLTNFAPIDNHTFDKVIDRNKKMVLAVSNLWDEMKGYNDIIQLSKLLNNQYQIVMVGVSDKQINELKTTKIIPIKRTNNQLELAELYSIASVFINTTYQDTFPTVNMEAQACGCPIITYDTGGSIETIDDSNGIIIEQGNINKLLYAIENLPNYNKENISNTAKLKYNRNVMCKKYLELLK